ncbi:MAG: ABC transporter ATP-binding protein [Desulfobacteraceae bacterium]|nr:ABC transporter ATP-binding protein [Desulfobacteraceae bacterium]
MMKDKLKILEATGLAVHLCSGKKRMPLLRDVSLSLEPGEILGVVGESGAGKTMLVRSLAGLLSPPARVTAGKIRYGGNSLDYTDPAAWNSLRGRGIFVMFQSAVQALNPSLTVGRQLLEAVDVGRRAGPGKAMSTGQDPGLPESQSRKADVDQIGELLEAVGLSPDLAGRYPFEISGGMKQRVQVATALALRPRVLIADEPTTGLDPVNQEVILGLLSALNRDFGTALILVSHDIRAVACLSRRILVMEQGRVAEAGYSDQVVSSPRSAAARQLVENMIQLEKGACPCRILN